MTKSRGGGVFEVWGRCSLRVMTPDLFLEKVAVIQVSQILFESKACGVKWWHFYTQVT